MVKALTDKVRDITANRVHDSFGKFDSECLFILPNVRLGH